MTGTDQLLLDMKGTVRRTVKDMESFLDYYLRASARREAEGLPTESADRSARVLRRALAIAYGCAALYDVDAAFIEGQRILDEEEAEAEKQDEEAA